MPTIRKIANFVGATRYARSDLSQSLLDHAPPLFIYKVNQERGFALGDVTFALAVRQAVPMTAHKQLQRVAA